MLSRFLNISITVLCFTILIFIDNQSQAASQLKHPAALKINSIMKGSFQQSKYISVLSKPLESHGSFILSKSTGLYWRQLEPFLSEIYITDSYVSQRTKGGDKKKYSKKEQPILQSISHIFLSIWNNDMKQLESIFDIKVIDSKTSWEFHLTPKDPSVKKYIASIYIKGNEYISSVTINENNHDYTVIKVTSVSGAEILNDDEINLIKGL